LKPPGLGKIKVLRRWNRTKKSVPPISPRALSHSRLLFPGFLGPSSTWAYTHQVIVDIKKCVSLPDSPDVPPHVDGNAYDFDWTLVGDTPFTKRELPSLDHALYLMNTVNFHIAQLYHLFDEVFFTEGHYKFYENSTSEIPNYNLWYIQYLLVIALGKTFLVQRAPGDPPPGAIFFARAMKLLPDVKGLYHDTTLSISD
ncbi:hypothetical protein BO71DRAFT_475541, partial [Aspergillus ellipticus CBS 707.79]